MAKWKDDKETSEALHNLHLVLQSNIEVYDEEFQIRASYVSVPYPENLSLFLRKVFSTYISYAQNVFSSAPVNRIYLHKCPGLDITFFDVKFQMSNGTITFIIVGPFLEQMPDQGKKLDIARFYRLPKSEHQNVRDYFMTIPLLLNRTQAIAQIISQTLLYPSMVEPLPFIAADEDETVVSRYPDAAIALEERTRILQYHESEKILYKEVRNGNLIEAQNVLIRLWEGNIFPNHFHDRIQLQKDYLRDLHLIMRRACLEAGANIVETYTRSHMLLIRLDTAQRSCDMLQTMQEMAETFCNLALFAKLKSYSPYVKDAIQYLHCNYQRRVTLAETAGAIHISEGYLSRIFIAETSMSIREYLCHIRVQESLILLENTNRSILDIAITVGFSSYEKYSAYFKKEMRMTAREYVKKYRR